MMMPCCWSWDAEKYPFIYDSVRFYVVRGILCAFTRHFLVVNLDTNVDVQRPSLL
jgi:hypothetical protein